MCRPQAARRHTRSSGSGRDTSTGRHSSAAADTRDLRALRHTARATVTGTVTYRLRIALTPEAVVQVELRDVSRQDVEAPLIAKQVITRPGQVPVAFALDYDPAAILPGGLYAVSARIEDRGQLAFVTDAPVPVITGGAPTSAEIVVGPVR